MTTLIVPSLEEEPWPTLGPQVCSFIEEHLVYGPGDLRGEPYRIESEFRAQLFRAYEVFPPSHPRAGKRRFKRVALSLRKGTAKTEKAAIVAAVELHPDGPVRCDGFDANGQPVGRGVRDPYIPMVAYTEEQTEELAFGALYVILSESPLADDFDIGLERVVVLDERGRAAGKAVPLAGSPNARDGARTTFQHFDETHRFTLDSLRRGHKTMLANIPKRPMADPWSLETTTSYTPGEGSVAESTMDYAKAVAAGKLRDSSLFFFHRQASDGHDLSTKEGRRAAVVESSGPAAEWSDIDTIVAQWEEPDADPAYLERVWLNRPRQAARQAFDAERWREKLVSPLEVAAGELIVLGFDGARRRDATALVATHIESGFQWPVGIWERPHTAEDDWEMPASEIDATVAEAFDRWNVFWLYGDPPYWDDWLDAWAARYGERRVIRWWTNRHKPMAYALRSYEVAQQTGTVTHNGDPLFAAHIGNAQKRELPMFDDDGKRLWIIEKERSDSPDKIDAAMAGCLSWEARGDAIAKGAVVKVAQPGEFVSF